MRYRRMYHLAQGTHTCGVPIGGPSGWCPQQVPNTEVRCPKHAVYVNRRGEHIYVAVEQVKAGDRIVI